MFVVRPGQGRIGSQVSHRRTPRLHIVAEMGRAAGVQGGKISRDEILALPSAKGSVSTYDATWPTASRRPRWSVTRPPARSQRRPRWSVTRPPARSQRRPRWSVTRPPARSQRRPSLATRPAIRPEQRRPPLVAPTGHPAGAAATPTGHPTGQPRGYASGGPAGRSPATWPEQRRPPLATRPANGGSQRRYPRRGRPG